MTIFSGFDYGRLLGTKARTIYVDGSGGEAGMDGLAKEEWTAQLRAQFRGFLSASDTKGIKALRA